MKNTYKNFRSFKLANCQKSVQIRLVVYIVFLSWFSFRLRSLDVALYVVSAVLPDHKFCKQPKDWLKQQLFGCLQNLGSGNTAETVYNATVKDSDCVSKKRRVWRRTLEQGLWVDWLTWLNAAMKFNDHFSPKVCHSSLHCCCTM